MPTIYKPKVACPWCGELPDICDAKDPLGATGMAYWCECGNFDCPMLEVSTRSYDTKAEAVRAWDGRFGGAAAA